MAKLITGEALKQAVREGSFIQGALEENVEGVKYDFRLSPRLLKAKFGRPIDYGEMTGAEKSEAVVEPGEVVFVLTEESLNLPQDIMAELSPKRKLSHAGILTLGGFCIDPKYRGRLLIGLYNLSSTQFPLMPGKKLIAATFSRLDPAEVDETAPVPDSVRDFPDDLVKMIKEYEPIALKKISEDLAAVRTQIQLVSSAIESDRDWRERFEKYLDAHNEQIGKLSDSLEKEKEARQLGQSDIHEAIRGLQGNLAFLKGAAWVGLGILSVAGALLVAWLVKTLL